jgi:RND family efflux transporter MFP subunit
LQKVMCADLSSVDEVVSMRFASPDGLGVGNFVAMKSGWPHLGCLGAILAMLLVSCGKSDKSKARRLEVAPRAVRVTQAESRPMERTLHVVGTLSAHEEATVAAQVAGQIETNRVDLGDRVTAGQELALIDTTSYDALTRQSAALLTKATAAAASATQNLKRVQDLQKEKIASTSDLDLAVAEAGKTAADVKAAEATDAIARLNLQRSRVHAPFAGAVAERIASAGDYVAIGTPILKLVKTDPLRLRLDVPERESVAVRSGQKVRVTVEGDTNIYAGRLARVAPAIRDTDRMLPVEADVPNPGALRAGLFAHAEIIVSESENAISVPASSLLVFAGIEKVVTIKEGKALERTVTTGRRGAEWVEIVSGLSVGEAVVIEPAGLRTGQPLTINNATENSPISKARAESGR